MVWGLWEGLQHPFHYRKSDAAEISHLLTRICYLREHGTGCVGGVAVAPLLCVQDHTQTARVNHSSYLTSTSRL